jgi:hypothetical protein
LYQVLHAMQHPLARDASLQNQWLHAWQQHRLARDALLQISNGTAARMAAASLGTWCLARNQLRHTMRHRWTCDASLQNQWLHAV